MSMQDDLSAWSEARTRRMMCEAPRRPMPTEAELCAPLDRAECQARELKRWKNSQRWYEIMEKFRIARGKGLVET